MDEEITAFIRDGYAPLLRRAFLLTGDAGLVEDLVQESLAKLWRAWSRRVVENPDAYVRRVTVNSSISTWRRRRPARTMPDSDPRVLAVPDGAEASAEHDRVWGALTRLPPRQSVSADDLDHVVRETQHRYAEAIHSTRDPVPEIFARVQRTRRRRRALAAVAAAAVTVAVIGVVVRGDGLRPGGDTTGLAVASPPTPTSSATAPSAPRTLEDALRTQLQANPAVRKNLVGYSSPPYGVVLCSIHVFGADRRHEHLYTFVGCATYSTGPLARELSGGGDPALLTVTGRGAETKVEAVRFPRIDHYDQDIAAMFPAPIVTVIARREFPTVPTGDQLLAEARALGTQ